MTLCLEYKKKRKNTNFGILQEKHLDVRQFEVNIICIKIQQFYGNAGRLFSSMESSFMQFKLNVLCFFSPNIFLLSNCHYLTLFSLSGLLCVIISSSLSRILSGAAAHLRALNTLNTGDTNIISTQGCLVKKKATNMLKRREPLKYSPITQLIQIHTSICTNSNILCPTMFLFPFQDSWKLNQSHEKKFSFSVIMFQCVFPSVRKCLNVDQLQSKVFKLFQSEAG